MHDEASPLIIDTWASAREVYRSKDLRQGLYDSGVLMDNVLINLHGLEHRDRRRLENPMFRRDVLFHYEREAFPTVLAARLESHLLTGRLDLMSFGHGVMLELAAVNAGIDLDIGDEDATSRLYQQLLLFIDGARMLDYTGDKVAKEKQVADALDRFATEFMGPAISRRRELLELRDHGEITEDEVPRDILRVMLENVEGLDLDSETILHEVAFFLVTGAGTSAVTLTMTLDNIFGWIAERPWEEDRLIEDPTLVQRCILESLRLTPISPIAARWAIADFTLSDGTEIHAGDRVHINMAKANRDRSVFGPTRAEFDPDRELPSDVPLHGVSFGHGMHACIGQELAVGIDPDPSDGFDHRLFGLVGFVVQELIGLGVRPDPDDLAVIDSSNDRGLFSRYPVLLTRCGAQETTSSSLSST